MPEVPPTESLPQMPGATMSPWSLVLRTGLAQLCCVVCLLGMLSPAWAQQYVPDYYMVTTTGAFRPVRVPGTQRRVAQNDAELQARKQIYEYVGAMKISRSRTVNEVVAHDPRLKARLLEYIRTAEVVDWRVNPACACVQVWVRVDLNFVRSIIAECGYR